MLLKSSTRSGLLLPLGTILPAETVPLPGTTLAVPGNRPRVSSQRNEGTTTGMVAQLGEYVLLRNLPAPASPTVQKSPKSSTNTLPAGGLVVTATRSTGSAVRAGPAL